MNGFRPTRSEMWKMIYYYQVLSPQMRIVLDVKSPGGEPRRVEVDSKITKLKTVVNLTDSIDLNEAIRRLKGSNDHFRHLYDEYHRIDDEIYRIEEEIDFATDQEIEEMKMRRAKLKDYIYHLIRHAAPACPTCQGTGMAQQTQPSPQ